MLKKSLKVELPILKKHAPENPENKILGKQLTFINRKEGIQRMDPYRTNEVMKLLKSPF